MIRNLLGPRNSHSIKPAAGRTRNLRAEMLEPRTLMSAAGLVQYLADNANAAVQNSSQSYVNFGNSTYMAVSKAATTGNECQSYARFDMSGISGTVNSAVLELTALQWTSNSSTAQLCVQLLPDAGDNWVEGNGGSNTQTTGPITWNNRPMGQAAAITIPVSQWPSNGLFSINVTSLLTQSFNANHVASFELYILPSPGSQSGIYFATRENSTAAYRPTLVVSSSTPSQPPTVATAAYAGAGTVTGTSTTLAVLGADAAGASNLSYAWSATTLPTGAAAPTFSVNGSNAAQNTSVTFAAAGTYVFTARISDPSGLSVTSSVTVVVSPTLSRITLTPAAVTLAPGASQQFAAAGFDQFGKALAALPGLTWSTGAGTITSGGLFTAPAAPASATVTAASGSIKGTASATVATPGFPGLKDATLAALVQSLDADGSISRNDMIQILDTVSGEGSIVSSTDFSDLKTILSDAATLKMPGYVQVLAGNVINGNTANANFQGQALGNLAAGCQSSRLSDLVAKWFLGADHPGLPAGTTYRATAGSLFNGNPSNLNEIQGDLGDCYFISSLGSIADASPAAIQNMFIYNGDNTWTVRFYYNGTADYVTVDNMLPVNSAGQLVYADYGCSAASKSNTLWIPLAEKAYAQWNQTGKEGRDGQNLYSSIAGGWMADVDAQVLGHSATSYNLITGSDQAALVSAMNNKLAVTIGTDSSNLSSDLLAYGLYGGHAYAIIGYNAAAGTFTLYNPWGCDQPNGALTWSQLQSTCEGFVVASVAGSVPISQVSAQSVRAAVAANPLAGPLQGNRGAIDQLLTGQATYDLAGKSAWSGLADARFAGGTSAERFALAADELFGQDPA
jgi:hypothetical protein